MFKTSSAKEQYTDESLLDDEAFAQRVIELCKVHTLVQENSGKVIKIYEMGHIGPKELYDKTNAELKKDYDAGMEIHLEGIDWYKGDFVEEEEIPNLIDYDAEKRVIMSSSSVLFAKRIGAVIQNYPDVPYKTHDASYDQIGSLEMGFLKSAVQMDQVKENFKSNIKNIKRDLLFEKRKTPLELKVRGRRQLLSLIEPDGREEIPRFFWYQKNIIDRRNEIAAAFALSTTKSVSLSWGKRHAAGLIRIFENSGYTLTSSE